MVLTVCDPPLLPNGLCNNGSHSSPAGLSGRGRLLCLCRQTRRTCVCLHMRRCRVLPRPAALRSSACVWPVCTRRPRCRQREELHVAELILYDMVVAPRWAALSSAAMHVGHCRPPTSGRDGEKKEKTALTEGRPSDVNRRVVLCYYSS